mmetsp:Transcript_4492/g.11904  ORF Transcript_4492/g.11904 Transcript_4492/m.11904 type:complete len:212 (+) Transcript_4492:611-1246(+)
MLSASAAPSYRLFCRVTPSPPSPPRGATMQPLTAASEHSRSGRLSLRRDSTSQSASLIAKPPSGSTKSSMCTSTARTDAACRARYLWGNLFIACRCMASLSFSSLSLLSSSAAAGGRLSDARRAIISARRRWTRSVRLGARTDVVLPSETHSSSPLSETNTRASATRSATGTTSSWGTPCEWEVADAADRGVCPPWCDGCALVGRGVIVLI